MTTTKQIFENLLDELQRETSLEPKERNNDHKNSTLQHFLEHDRRTEEHDLWRECRMLKEMLAILNRRFIDLNPHKRSEAEIKEILAEKTTALSSHHFEALWKYEQETDQTGRSQLEIDSATTTKYPSISRYELEILAAENYLHSTWGIARKYTTSGTIQQDITVESRSRNANPKMSWKEFSSVLKKGFHSDTTIRQAVTRCISDNYGKAPEPWLMGGCASEYQIVDPEIKRNKDHPTPASCKYQKISQGKTLNVL